MDSTVFDFTADADPADWRIVNDTVMGGQSESRFVTLDDAARFTGTLSTDGGGFVSIRAPEGRYDFGSADGLRLRVRGDGRTYNLTLYTKAGGGISYRYPFVAPDAWATVDVRFNDLTPYRRGRRVPSAPAFDPSDVRTLGILLADETDGPFELDVQAIAET